MDNKRTLGPTRDNYRCRSVSWRNTLFLSLIGCPSKARQPQGHIGGFGRDKGGPCVSQPRHSKDEEATWKNHHPLVQAATTQEERIRENS
jgi:hypothetical protein